MDDIKRAYHKKALAAHPYNVKIGDTHAFKLLLAAFLRAMVFPGQAASPDSSYRLGTSLYDINSDDYRSMYSPNDINGGDSSYGDVPDDGGYGYGYDETTSTSSAVP